jgi:hypothetical protein
MAARSSSERYASRGPDEIRLTLSSKNELKKINKMSICFRSPILVISIEVVIILPVQLLNSVNEGFRNIVAKRTLGYGVDVVLDCVQTQFLDVLFCQST